MPPSDGHQPVALAVGGGGHAHDRLVEGQGAGGAVEGGVAEGEDAAVAGHQPVALAVGGRRHAHHGLLRVREPVEPKKAASPKAKMPPSLATSQ